MLELPPENTPDCPNCGGVLSCTVHHSGRYYECFSCSSVFAFRPVTVFRLIEIQFLPNFNPISEQKQSKHPKGATGKPQNHRPGRTASKASVEAQ